MDHITEQIAKELNRAPQQVQNVIDLLDAGNTIPFIARYRKERTGSMDDQTLRDLAERLEYLRNLEKRREEIGKALEEQGVLTDELTLALQKAQTLAELEDIYRPFRPKRRTRATIAKERGLEPLALWLLLPLILGQDGIFFAEPAAWLGAEVLLMITYYRKIRRLTFQEEA